MVTADEIYPILTEPTTDAATTGQTDGTSSNSTTTDTGTDTGTDTATDTATNTGTGTTGAQSTEEIILDEKSSVVPQAEASGATEGSPPQLVEEAED